MKYLIFLFSFFLLSCGNSNSGFYSTLNDSKSSAIKNQLENYLSKNYEQMSAFYHDSLMLFVSGSSDTLHYSDVLEGIELHHTLFSNIDIPMEDESLHVETSSYGKEVWSKAYFTWNAKGRYSKQAISNAVHIAYKWAEDKVIEEHHYSDRTAFEKEISLYSEINN
tara:strand:- start:5277 stop:5774 length:498 start_codon:yes stop_codon:yes gene_type:complete